MTERFIVDGYDLYAAYKIIVESAEGLDVIPKVKSREQHSWPDESGVDVATNTGLIYDSMDVSLSCVVVESTYKEAIKRINGLIALLSGSGLHLLGSVTRGRLYPVLLDSISSYKRVNATSNSEVWIKFTLKLLCPLPECRMGSATVTASGAVNLNANTSKQVTVWWGDGTTSTGTGALNHTYTNAGTYTVLIAGTGVTKSVFTTTVITIDEYSYPASGDVQNVDVSHTSEETWNALQAHLANLSPEYANPQITTLKSVADGGIIPNAEATWLGATAKSVLSYLQKLVAKVYAINSRVAVLENNVILDVTLAVDTLNLTLTLPSTEDSVLLEYGSPTGMNSNDTVNSYLQINGVTTYSYVTSTLRNNTVLFYTGRHAFFGTLEIRRINGYLFFVNTAQHIWGNASTQTIAGRFMQGFLEIAQPGVNSITIFGNYKAGTRFKLLRQK